MKEAATKIKHLTEIKNLLTNKQIFRNQLKILIETKENHNVHKERESTNANFNMNHVPII